MSLNTHKQCLLAYYKRIFPSDDLYRWLSYGDNINFMCREFSFIIRQTKFLRYLAFSSKEMMKLEFLKFIPDKIDIGGIYNASPQCRKSQHIFPIERELVFDIDLTDYDQRTCCVETDACQTCWKFVFVTATILKDILIEDFGFKHILWVFSGRRGLHCWVCDKEAKQLTALQRRSIINYLTIFKNTEQLEPITKTLRRKQLPYSVRRAMKIAETMFEPLIVSKANILGTEKGVKYFLDRLPDDDTRNDVTTLFQEFETSLERWNAFVSYFNNRTTSCSKDRSRWEAGKRFLDAVRLIYCYPRVDKAVTESDIHLLKSPFSVHPNTGKISIPLRFEDIENFDPGQAPSLSTTVDKMKNVNDTSLNNLCHRDQELDNFSRSLATFKDFVAKLVID